MKPDEPTNPYYNIPALIEQQQAEAEKEAAEQKAEYERVVVDLLIGEKK